MNDIKRKKKDLNHYWLKGCIDSDFIYPFSNKNHDNKQGLVKKTLPDRKQSGTPGKSIVFLV